VLLAFLSTIAVPVRAASVDEAEPFHLVVSTKHLSWLKDHRNEAARVEVISVPISQLDVALNELRPILPDFNRTRRRPTWAVDISGGRDREFVQQTLLEATSRFQKVFPNARPRFETNVIDEDQITVAKLAADLKSAVQEIEEQNPMALGVLEGAAAAREAIAEAEQEALHMAPCEQGDLVEALEEKVASLIPETPSAAEARRTACKFANGQAIFVVVSRIATLLRQGIEVAVPERLAAGLTLTIGDALITYFSLRFQTKINRAFSHHGLPFSSQYETLQKMFDAYKSKPALQFAKGLMLNVLSYGLAKNLAMQAIGSYAVPSSTHFPTMDDVWDLGKNSGVGAAFYVLGQMGLDLLRQKGWISQTHIEHLFKYISVLDTISGVLNSNPSLRHWRVLSQGPVWGLYLAAFVLGTLAPVRNQRFLLIDSRIKNRDDVDLLEVSGITWRTGFKVDEIKTAVAEISKLPVVQRKNWCARVLAHSNLAPMIAPLVTPLLMDK